MQMESGSQLNVDRCCDTRQELGIGCRSVICMNNGMRHTNNVETRVRRRNDTRIEQSGLEMSTLR